MACADRRCRAFLSFSFCLALVAVVVAWVNRLVSLLLHPPPQKLRQTSSRHTNTASFSYSLLFYSPFSLIHRLSRLISLCELRPARGLVFLFSRSLYSNLASLGLLHLASVDVCVNARARPRVCVRATPAANQVDLVSLFGHAKSTIRGRRQGAFGRIAPSGHVRAATYPNPYSTLHEIALQLLATSNAWRALLAFPSLAQTSVTTRL